MKKENVIRTVIICIILLFTIVLFYSIKISSTSNEEYEKMQLKENVLFQLNNDKPIEVDISEHSFVLNNNLDIITISKVINENNIINPTLFLNLYNCIVEVYIDGEIYYEYGKEQYNDGKIIGHEFLNISLPNDLSNKELKVKLTFTEKYTYSVLPPIFIQNSNNYINEFATDNLLNLLVTMTLTLFGVISTLFSLTKRRYSNEMSNITIIGLFSILIATWINTSSGIAFLFINNFQVVSFLEYFSLYAAPIPVLIYFGRLQIRDINKRLINMAFKTLSLFVICALCLYVFFGVNYIELLKIYHIIVFLSGIFILYCSIKSNNNKKKSEKILIYGMLLMAIIVISDLIRFNLEKYVISNIFLDTSFIPIGMLVFVIAIVYSYTIELLESSYSQKERKLLEGFAYVDFLTSINNRRKCEEIIKELECTEKDVIIVNCDINGLKFINDTYGHNSGDVVIKEFANCLREVFDDIGEVGRMGGDEFIVIIVGQPEKIVIEKIQKLNLYMDKFNKDINAEFKLSASIGYSIRKSYRIGSVWEAYENADKCMYINKKKYKEKIK